MFLVFKILKGLMDGLYLMRFFVTLASMNFIAYVELNGA